MLFLLHLLAVAWALAVAEIDDQSFVPALLSSNYTLVYFYKNQCQYCQQFNADFEYLSLIYNSNPGFQIVKVNGVQNKRINRLFKVDRYPTLKLYHNSTTEIITFTQQRSVDAISDFISIHVPEVEPDYSKFKSNIATMPDKVDEAELKNT